MGLKLYNTLTRMVEGFKPLKKGEVLYYTCGPTVHNYAHIGNFRTFVVQDVIKRWLRASGYTIRHVMNITDVDEKTIERAARLKTTLKELTLRYEKAFLEDLDCLNIERADHIPRVSDNIEAIAMTVKELYEKGHAKKDEKGSYYYDINTFPGYGALSGVRPKRRIRSVITREDYKAPKNFLLWRSCEKDHTTECFESPIGKGLPGWHIECAALALKYLGPTLDIHSGGADLIFPHHENEIAEAEGATDSPFSRFWIHVEHLIVEGRKMSKSLGNFYTLRQIMKKGFDPRALRLVYLKTHYREKLDFSFEELERSGCEIMFLEDFLSTLNPDDNNGTEDYVEEIKDFKGEFTRHMNDDLHTERAVKSLFHFIEGMKPRLRVEATTATGSNNIKEAIDWAVDILGFMGECLY